jgi:hypothetical protein
MPHPALDLHTVYSACCGHHEECHTDDGVCLDCRSNDPDNWQYAHAFEPIKLASGGVAGPDGYKDCRAAWLCHHEECQSWRQTIRDRIYAYAPVTVVTAGTFGALVASTLSEWIRLSQLLWTPKDHGLICTPFPPPPAGTKVVLVEDVVTTHGCRICDEPESDHLAHKRYGNHFFEGGTLWRMRRWCEEQKFEIVGEVIASEIGANA